jgi:c-di-GMP-binding flagellar brake protein YcgR
VVVEGFGSMTARRSGIGGASQGAAFPDRSDRRRTERIDAVVRSTVRLAELEDQLITRARVVDISDMGVRMLLRRRLPVGARVLVDMECELPLRVHLGYDAHSLVVDGPMHMHLVRIAGTVTRLERRGGMYEVGIEFCEDTTRFDELQVLQFYVDHLREQEAWSS